MTYALLETLDDEKLEVRTATFEKKELGAVGHVGMRNDDRPNTEGKAR